MESYDILIIGAGAAGIAAAKAAASVGCQNILLVDRKREPGGVLLQCFHHGFGSNLTVLVGVAPAKIPQKAVTNWENSSGHFQTMIDPAYDSIGVGITIDNGRAFCYMFAGDPAAYNPYS